MIEDCLQRELVTTDGQAVPSTRLLVACALFAESSLFPTIDIVGVGRSLVVGDFHRKLRVSHTTTSTITVPLNASIGFPPGTPILIEWEVNSVGVVQVAAAPGVTIDTAETLQLRKPGSIGCLLFDGTGGLNRWAWFGDLNLA